MEPEDIAVPLDFLPPEAPARTCLVLQEDDDELSLSVIEVVGVGELCVVWLVDLNAAFSTTG